ncbi:MAG: response regulator [Cyclobacteriaceae bacterium]
MKRIAVIDDDEVFQLIIKKQIEMKNITCEIMKFFNGEEAINYLNANIQEPGQLPHMIMLDVNMPIKDGWEFLEDYETLPSEVKNSITLYMVTSSVIQSDIDKAKKDNNIKDFISKPIPSERLDMMFQ